MYRYSTAGEPDCSSVNHDLFTEYVAKRGVEYNGRNVSVPLSFLPGRIRWKPGRRKEDPGVKLLQRRERVEERGREGDKQH